MRSVLALMLAAAEPIIFSVEDYGAKADNGTTLCTSAFRNATEAAAAAVRADPAARPVVKAAGPGVYVTGSFNLTSAVTLDIAPAATIFGVGSHDGEQYTVLPPLASYGVSRDDGCVNSDDSEDKGVCVNRFQALVMVSFADGARITGGGTLNGGGEFFWKNRHTQKNGRPHLVEIYNSTNTEIGNVTLKDSPFWTLHPVYSKGVWIHHINIQAPTSSPNTDGIDPDSSQDVLIEDCMISCGDDHIAIKSGIDAAGRAVGIPSKNITVRRNVHLAGRGISIGSEVSGGVEQVRFVDIQHLGPSEHGLHIKTSASRGGYVRDVTYENITLGEVVGDKLISVTTDYGLDSHSTSNVAETDIRDIRYSNLSRPSGNATLKDEGAGEWSCFSKAPCHNITLEHVHLNPAKNWACSHIAPAEISHPVDDVSPPGLSKCF